jgi:hypothetical protein
VALLGVGGQDDGERAGLQGGADARQDPAAGAPRDSDPEQLDHGVLHTAAIIARAGLPDDDENVKCSPAG